MSKTKVLIVSNMYPSATKKYSGIFVKNQFVEIKRQAGDDLEISIYAMKRSMTGALGSVWKYLKFFVGFTPFLFRRYQVVHLHYFVPLIVAVWAYKLFHPKTKLMVTFHGGDINAQVNKKNQWLYRLLAKKMDLAVPVGRHVAENVHKKLGVEKQLILPVGVDNRVFYPEENPQKQYDFIYVGSFFHVKGIDIFFEALEAMGKQVRFCVVGKGPEYQKKFESLIEDGYQIDLKIDQSHEQLRGLYNQARFLVLPSRSEGFPTVTVEAMFCATPVITSDIPQFLEQVREGENGFTFDRTNPKALIELMKTAQELSEEKYEQMQNAALQSFPELALERICERLIKEYQC
ncbi:glycosyltransferase family 4 protein [Gilvibacter sediminis]|uniref:glycosyltransferase family 4 protein n=1 Tax=Gilvibacter sediminis TaxID=379071 RepID=UPI002350EAED|nr:glycosyltransferase family 4 protein [Gilvibacter sediminis]MDC7996790.1 glycosyltransferase family 4 protein [Gilvibacter sediminis]